MVVLGLVVQVTSSDNSNSTNLAVVTRKQLHVPEAIQIAKKFSLHLEEAKRNNKTEFDTDGSLLIGEYRLTFRFLYEVILFSITESHDCPFLGLDILQNGKDVLTSLCKGDEITSAKLKRCMLELNFGLQRTLNGHNGTEILTQKTADMSPHIKIRSDYSSPNLKIPKDDSLETNEEKELERKRVLDNVSFVIPEEIFCSLPPSKPAPPPRKK